MHKFDWRQTRSVTSAEKINRHDARVNVGVGRQYVCSVNDQNVWFENDQNVWSHCCEHLDLWMTIYIEATVLLHQVCGTVPLCQEIILQNVQMSSNATFRLFCLNSGKSEFSLHYEGPSPICVSAGNVLMDSTWTRIQWVANFSTLIDDTINFSLFQKLVCCVTKKGQLKDNPMAPKWDIYHKSTICN